MNFMNRNDEVFKVGELITWKYPPLNQYGDYGVIINKRYNFEEKFEEYQIFWIKLNKMFKYYIPEWKIVRHDEQKLF